MVECASCILSHRPSVLTSLCRDMIRVATGGVWVQISIRCARISLTSPRFLRLYPLRVCLRFPVRLLTLTPMQLLTIQLQTIRLEISTTNSTEDYELENLPPLPLPTPNLPRMSTTHRSSHLRKGGPNRISSTRFRLSSEFCHRSESTTSCSARWRRRNVERTRRS